MRQRIRTLERRIADLERLAPVGDDAPLPDAILAHRIMTLFALIQSGSATETQVRAARGVRDMLAEAPVAVRLQSEFPQVWQL